MACDCNGAFIIYFLNQLKALRVEFSYQQHYIVFRISNFIDSQLYFISW